MSLSSHAKLTNGSRPLDTMSVLRETQSISLRERVDLFTWPNTLGMLEKKTQQDN